MFTIMINNKEYKNVSSISPTVEYDYYYEVTTMDGNIHRRLRGKRTNYDIVFFNSNFEEYANLKKMLSLAETVTLRIYKENNENPVADYYVYFNGDEAKGELWNGQNYYTGLSVTFKRVGYESVWE